MKNIILAYIVFGSIASYSATIESEPNYSFNSKEFFYKNRRAKYPIGLNVLAFGPAGIGGLSLDWFISPKVNLEMGAGFIDIKSLQPSYFIGGKYHVFGKTISNTTPYFGVFDRISINSTILNHQMYIPIGLQRIKKSKLTWNLEVAYTYNLNDYKSQVWGAFKLGYRFNRINKKKNLKIG